MSSEAPTGRTAKHFQRSPKPPGETPTRSLRMRPLLWAAAYVLVTTLSFSPALSFRDSPATPGGFGER